MWPYPAIVAHRGGGILAPENTLAAMRCGHARGYRGVEFDVMLSQDGVPILMHDPILGRTVAGVGSIADYRAAQLLQMDAGTWFGTAFADEPVPSFAQVIEFCRAHDLWMNVEIKPVPGFEKATGAAVARMAQDYFASAGVSMSAASSTAPSTASTSAPGTRQNTAPGTLLPLLSSFSIEALVAAKSEAPDLPRGLLADRLPMDWREQLAITGAGSLHLNQRFLTAEAARAIKQAGVGLFCYTVNTISRAAEILEWGVDAFCTDRLDLIGSDFKTR